MAPQDSEKDVESGKSTGISWFTIVSNQHVVTPEIVNWNYQGSGTEDDPYIVEWIDQDPRNPMLWPKWLKWSLTQLVAVSTLAVAFVSSAYSGGIGEVIAQFHTSEEVIILGVSLFVLGFALGPLIWAPLSELYGRQYLFIGTYAMLTAFNAGAAGAQNVQTLIVLRFFAGAFGSSPLTNAGGVIADMFPANERGLAMSLFAAAPFLGPVLGPIVGGFAGETIGWRWVEGIMAIFTGTLWILGTFLLPETYPPVLLRQRAKKLAEMTGKVYKTQADAEQGQVSVAHAFKTSLLRPWILLFREPIVLLLSIYMAIVYGTLYMMFAAFPIVYQEYRGWSAGIGGLAFLGVAVGMLLAVGYSIWDNGRYVRIANNDPSGFAPPEARLPPAMIGGICLPIGLFWFAWTNGPSIHWIVSIIACVPFGFGMVLIFLAIMNYLIDAYVIFAASTLAANSVLRSCFGAAFPLFTTYMYDNLGIHWASTIPAFLALVCTPMPFLFYKYGPAIRSRCKFAAEAAAFLERIRGAQNKEEEHAPTSDDDGESLAEGGPSAAAKEKDIELEREREEDAEQEAFDYSYDDEAHQPHDTRFRKIRTAPAVPLQRTKSNMSAVDGISGNGYYDPSPFDIDRVNTRDSFRPGLNASRTGSTVSVARPATLRPTTSRGQSAMSAILGGRKPREASVGSETTLQENYARSSKPQGNVAMPQPAASRPESIKSGRSGKFF